MILLIPMQTQPVFSLVRAHGNRSIVLTCLWLLTVVAAWSPRSGQAQSTTNQCETVLVFGTGTSDRSEQSWIK